MLVGFIQSLLYVLIQNKISVCYYVHTSMHVHDFVFIFCSFREMFKQADPLQLQVGLNRGFSFTRFTFCDKNSLLEQVLQTVHVDNVKISSSE